MRYENRTCIICGEAKDILQRFKHATNICKECTNERAKFYLKRAAENRGQRIRPGRNGRIPYPLVDGETTPNAKFRKIAQKMMKLKYRDEWILQIKENFDSIPLDVLEWVYRHDTKVKTKKATKIKSDYPDTRYMDWDEYERGLGDDSVDS